MCAKFNNLLELSVEITNLAVKFENSIMNRGKNKTLNLVAA